MSHEQPTPGRRAAPANIIVLGCGRSGTSAVAGLLQSTGVYRLGTKLLEPSPLNPKGFFEDATVNEINERLLSRFTPNYSARFRRWPGYERSRPHRYQFGQRWLCDLPPDLDVRPRRQDRDAIARVVPPAPFCLKDPRFCYTLRAWRPLLGDFSVICVFRRPGATVSSILQAMETDRGLRSMQMTDERAEAIWRACYRSALAEADELAPDHPWLYLDYHDLVHGDAVRRLTEFVGVDIAPTFVDPALDRATDVSVSDDALALYDELRARSAG